MFNLMRRRKPERRLLRTGDRVFVPGETPDWPLGNGVITKLRSDFMDRSFSEVLLDHPARRHSSDGDGQRRWFVKTEILQAE